MKKMIYAKQDFLSKNRFISVVQVRPAALPWLYFILRQRREAREVVGADRKQNETKLVAAVRRQNLHARLDANVFLECSAVLYRTVLYRIGPFYPACREGGLRYARLFDQDFMRHLYYSVGSSCSCTPIWTLRDLVCDGWTSEDRFLLLLSADHQGRQY